MLFSKISKYIQYFVHFVPVIQMIGKIKRKYLHQIQNVVHFVSMYLVKFRRDNYVKVKQIPLST